MIFFQYTKDIIYSLFLLFYCREVNAPKIIFFKILLGFKIFILFIYFF